MGKAGQPIAAVGAGSNGSRRSFHRYARAGQGRAGRAVQDPSRDYPTIRCRRHDLMRASHERQLAATSHEDVEPGVEEHLGQGGRDGEPFGPKRDRPVVRQDPLAIDEVEAGPIPDLGDGRTDRDIRQVDRDPLPKIAHSAYIDESPRRSPRRPTSSRRGRRRGLASM